MRSSVVFALENSKTSRTRRGCLPALDLKKRDLDVSRQTLHRSVVPADGLLYEVLSMLYHHGIALNP